MSSRDPSILGRSDALFDADSHTEIASKALDLAMRLDGDRAALRYQLLRLASHELSSGLEALRSELGDETVSIEAQVEQPEKLGDRMTPYQREQLHVGQPKHEDLAAVLAKSILPCSSCHAEPRVSPDVLGSKCLARREAWVKAQSDLAARTTSGPLRREPNGPAMTMTRPVLSDVEASVRGMDPLDLHGNGLHSTGAVLTDADLTDADLTAIRDDFFRVLDLAPNEAPGLRAALVAGTNGSCYEGDCACLVGTIAKVRGCSYRELGALVPNAQRPAEKWFLGICPGMPVRHSRVSITLGWIDEWTAARAAAPAPAAAPSS